jgi:hypothetical protein
MNAGEGWGVATVSCFLFSLVSLSVILPICCLPFLILSVCGGAESILSDQPFPWFPFRFLHAHKPGNCVPFVENFNPTARLNSSFHPVCSVHLVCAAVGLSMELVLPFLFLPGFSVQLKINFRDSARIKYKLMGDMVYF